MRRDIARRTLLKAAAAASLTLATPSGLHSTPATRPALRTIPSSGEQLPCVGLGSWITFNVGNDPVLLDECAAVIKAFAAGGGRVIDSSPMYGSSQQTIGYGLDKLASEQSMFATDKVWTSDADGGRAQIETSRQAWRVPQFQLLQVHNLVAWQAHLEMLLALKADGKLSYVGITTSHGRRHGELEQIMLTQPVDFVQLTYNLVDREAEDRLLPLARDRGIAVIVNRPYQRGRLVDAMQRHPLPDWAEPEAGASSWAQLLLKFIVSHPAVTCAIPATTRISHVQENLRAGSGEPIAPQVREKLLRYVQAL